MSERAGANTIDRMIAALAAPFAALLLAPAAQAQASIDWAAAEAAFEADRASGNSPKKGKAAAKCAGYWVTHAGALNRGEFPQAALDVFDAELTSKDEASLNAMVFSTLFTDTDAYTDAKAEAEALLPGVREGERKATSAYFAQLGRCSMGAG